MGGVPEAGVVAAPLRQAARKNPLASVYYICPCPGDSDCARLLAGLPGTGGSQRAGGAAGVVLAAREGWQLPSLRPVAWTVSRYVRQAPRTQNQPQPGSHRHFLTGGEGMVQARTLLRQPQRTGSCGPGRAWFPSLVQLTLCRSQSLARTATKLLLSLSCLRQHLFGPNPGSPFYRGSKGQRGLTPGWTPQARKC